MKIFYRSSIIGIFFFFEATLLSQQVNISRIESMPNIPEPYLMRDWKSVAVGYDSLVFNFNAHGDSLPLIWLNTNTVNYPAHNSFGLHTVVGTKSPLSAEAINCLPAVISASLVGVDKTNQEGNNFVLMCEEWFNKRPEQNVYKNHPVDDTKDDWWYETMPNVFFYQLYNLYPNTGDFNYQFISIADQWLASVKAMGGSGIPWQVPNMNHTGWDLSTMTPFDGDVKEPESAGAIAWILYNAFNETGDDKYRIGAEWCMEYLNSLTSNPSYELQLAYGVYNAARMNKELGTDYNVEKMLNWCFEVGPLREWGAIVGRWGNYDVYGLIGEVNGTNDYAFSMNTMEQIGALVPLVRYDTRFARAIGKWVLNAANALRLFYTNYLPDTKQDSEEWAHQYDPNSYIAHEAMRQMKYGSSPYATGDAIDGGWGATNLTLYSSSHAGILGGIIDTTNVSKILKLDLLKTDYFNAEAYPTYLFFNPYATDKTISMQLENSVFDIYDAVSNLLLAQAVSGSVNLTVPADGVIVTVLIPSGSGLIMQGEKTIVNNIVIDYDNGFELSNRPPRIKSLLPVEGSIIPGQSTTIYCSATDRDNDNLQYSWVVDGGILDGSGSSVSWIAPSEIGNYVIQCVVEDTDGSKDSVSTTVQVLAFLNTPPVIDKITATPRKVNIGGETRIECFAYDDENDELTFIFMYDSTVLEGSGNSIVWNVPLNEGDYEIKCIVSDIRGAETESAIKIRVKDFSQEQSGNLVAYYPFSGNSNDVGGNNLSGLVSGAALTTDRFGNASNAFAFDGVNDKITVANNDLLNFQNAISICCWIKVGELYEREAYPLSHGSWENRWKVSITNKKFRWTLKTSNGIKDLDSETEIVKNTLYHLVVLFSGSDYEIYINGKLDSFSESSGAILKTSIDMTFGQVLPGNSSYNFKGTLDEIRIYDYALSYSEIQELQDYSTGIDEQPELSIPKFTQMDQNYPNPFNASTRIQYSVSTSENVVIELYDILGRKIKTLVNELLSPGRYFVTWDGTNMNGDFVSSGIYLYRMRAGKSAYSYKLQLLK